MLAVFLQTASQQSTKVVLLQREQLGPAHPAQSRVPPSSPTAEPGSSREGQRSLRSPQHHERRVAAWGHAGPNPIRTEEARTNAGRAAAPRRDTRAGGDATLGTPQRPAHPNPGGGLRDPGDPPRPHMAEPSVPPPLPGRGNPGNPGPAANGGAPQLGAGGWGATRGRSGAWPPAGGAWPRPPLLSPPTPPQADAAAQFPPPPPPPPRGARRPPSRRRRHVRRDARAPAPPRRAAAATASAVAWPLPAPVASPPGRPLPSSPERPSPGAGSRGGEGWGKRGRAEGSMRTERRGLGRQHFRPPPVLKGPRRPEPSEALGRPQPAGCPLCSVRVAPKLANGGAGLEGGGQ